MRIAAAVLAAVLAAAAAPAAAAPPKEPAPNKALAALFEREFRIRLHEFPELGTIFGIDGYDDRLADRSPEAVARRKAHVRKLIAELARFEPAKLTAQDRISRDVMLADLRLANEENALYGDLPFGATDRWMSDGFMPVSSMGGPQLDLPMLVKAARLRRAGDYDNYLKRLDAVPRALSQLMDTMRAGMRTGWMPPREAMTKVPEMFTVFAGADVTASPLWQPFASFPAEVAADDRARLTEAGRKVLAAKVHPAFAALKRFLETEYLPACKKELAASALPAGPAYYAIKVREQTTTALGPAQIHEIGKREVARIRGEMDRVIASTGFKGSFEEFLQFLRTDPRFFFKTPAERLAAYRDIAKRADAELPKLFAELPRVPYGIRAMEAYEGDNADHYAAPALDGSRAGFFEANVNNLAKRPSHEMESTLLHETVPGHHLQTARSYELQGLPQFRRSAWYGAYGEGWALYAESLGYEMGFYTDPYMRFGALSAEMLRACRLVIDTGVHAFGWQRDASIKYLADNSGVHPDFAAAEVDRYIVWPGQALAYKIGELKIRELRGRARQALGERFDVRRFHNALLDDGALPLGILEARIDEWIAKQPTGGKPAAKVTTMGARK